VSLPFPVRDGLLLARDLAKKFGLQVESKNGKRDRLFSGHRMGLVRRRGDGKPNCLEGTSTPGPVARTLHGVLRLRPARTTRVLRSQRTCLIRRVWTTLSPWRLEPPSGRPTAGRAAAPENARVWKCAPVLLPDGLRPERLNHQNDRAGGFAGTTPGGRRNCKKRVSASWFPPSPCLPVAESGPVANRRGWGRTRRDPCLSATLTIDCTRGAIEAKMA
jgi:hypothetical protein